MEAFMGTVLPVAFAHAPEYWSTCAGQELPIVQNQALSSLLGNIYGGTPGQTFAIPNLVGRVPVGAGANQQFGNINMGSNGGSQNVALGVNNLPAHAHGVSLNSSNTVVSASASAAAGDKQLPVDNSFLAGGSLANTRVYVNSAPAPGASAALGGFSVATKSGAQTDTTGSGTPFPIMQPFLALNFIICILGIYPPNQ